MRMLTKKSMADKARTKAEHTRELVMALLEWDAEQYGNFVLNMAIDYLKRQCGSDAYGVSTLLKSETFWKWWKNHWMLRDDAFLTIWADCNNLLDVRNEYEFLHCAANLNIYPNKKVLEASYAKMIGEFIDGGTK